MVSSAATAAVQDGHEPSGGGNALSGVALNPGGSGPYGPQGLIPSPPFKNPRGFLLNTFRFSFPIDDSPFRIANGE
jgi:hypothetical protein